MSDGRQGAWTLRAAGPRWLVLVGAGALALACGGDPPPPRPPGLQPGEARTVPVAPPPPTNAAEAPARPPLPTIPGDDPFDDRPTPQAPTNDPQGPQAEQPVEEEEKKRDLSAELRDALGRPTSCLDLAKAAEAGGKLSIRVSAYVAPSGRITRASVSAQGQPDESLRCIEKQALAVRMQEPIEDAPRRVDATIEFEVLRAGR